MTGGLEPTGCSCCGKPGPFSLFWSVKECWFPPTHRHVIVTHGFCGLRCADAWWEGVQRERQKAIEAQLAEARRVGRAREIACQKEQLSYRWVSVRDELEYAELSVIGRRIRRLRMVREWTQGELAVKVGVEQPVVSKWERGKSLAALDTQKALAEAFGVDWAAIYAPEPVSA